MTTNSHTLLKPRQDMKPKAGNDGRLRITANAIALDHPHTNKETQNGKVSNKFRTKRTEEGD